LPSGNKLQVGLTSGQWAENVGIVDDASRLYRSIAELGFLCGQLHIATQYKS